MDGSRFTDERTGRLVPIRAPVEDLAFVPDPLPDEVVLGHDVYELLIEATRALGRLDGAGRVAANPDLLLRPLRRREALKSSSLEGTYATAEELLLFERSSDAGSSAVREVANYAAALDRGIQLLEELPFCLRVVREMHRRLLDGVRGTDRRPGEFRVSQVDIGSDRRFVPAPPTEVPRLLDELERAFHARPPRIPHLLWCFLVHYQFETIHPFNDGNGRVGRLLLALMIAAESGLRTPWLYMSPWFDRYKDEYIDRLFGVSARGDWVGWLTFCLRGTVAQANDALSRLDRLIELQQDYDVRVQTSGGAARLGAIVSAFFTSSPITAIQDVADLCDVTYPTAQKDLEKLRELGIVTLHRERRPMLYIAHEVFKVGAEDVP